MVPCFFLSGNHHSESFTIANTSWLTATGYVCHTWPHIFSVCRSEALEFSRFFSSLSGTRVVHVVHVVHVVNLYDVIRYHVRAKTTFEFSSLRILLKGVHFCYWCYLYCDTYTGIQHDLYSLSSFISMFVLMLVCVTSDLEFVPSAWSKHFHS